MGQGIMGSEYMRSRKVISLSRWRTTVQESYQLLFPTKMVSFAVISCLKYFVYWFICLKMQTFFLVFVRKVSWCCSWLWHCQGIQGMMNLWCFDVWILQILNLREIWTSEKGQFFAGSDLDSLSFFIIIWFCLLSHLVLILSHQSLRLIILQLEWFSISKTTSEPMNED